MKKIVIFAFVSGLLFAFAPDTSAQFYGYPQNGYYNPYQQNGVIPFPYYPVYYPRMQQINPYMQNPAYFPSTSANQYTQTTPQIRNYYYYNTPAPQNSILETDSNNSLSLRTNDPSVTKTETASPSDSSDINKDYGSLAAAAIIGAPNKFLPSGLLQWIFLAILVAVMIYLWRYIHRSEDKYMNEPLKHA